MKNCPRCARENTIDAQYCGRCGLDMVSFEKTRQVQPAANAQFCYKHPKVETYLSCGRCEKPICTKCMVNGPAGQRCRECAKTKTEFRPGAVVYRAKQSVSQLGRVGSRNIYFAVIIVVTVLGAFRSCGQSTLTLRPPESASKQDEETIKAVNGAINEPN
jgi:ribosomal protein L40E